MAKRTMLATFLLDLSARAEGEGLDPRTLRLHVRRKDLAEHLDMTPGELERSFAELEARGIIDIDPEDTVAILDRPALELELGGERMPAQAAVPHDQTLLALRAILGDERFLATPRASALLVYLVEQVIADGATHLDVERIAIEVLGRPAGFDPTDPTLRVLITHLEKMLDEYDASTPDKAVSIRLDRGTCRVTIEPRERAGKVRATSSGSTAHPSTVARLRSAANGKNRCS